ncbi:MAG: hypothetical protein LC754_11270 [Acidobacteria bacterium]|nr:hypothetical protein [Acidobacteriota bacterium]
MSGKFLTTVLAVALGSTISFAQAHNTRASANAGGSASAHGDGRQLSIASGTQLTAQLQSTLDAGKARVGDEVVLKTTEAIKSNGQTIVKKGARLVGRVTDVSRKAKGSAESSVTLLFDRLENGSLSAPISATINSVTQATTRARINEDEASADASASSRSSTRTQGNSGGGGGGLLGGVTGAVGSTVGATTRTTGDVLNGTTETVGGAVSGVGRTLGQVRVTQSGSASVEGTSTLSLTGGNLRLDKGTTFRLTVNESANVNQ